MAARKESDRKLAVDAVGDLAIVMTRDVAAPGHLVFDAWTKPEQVARWLGGRNWTVAVCDIDLRVGGAWRYVLHGPENMKLGLKGTYREIAPPARLVYTESCDDGEGGTLRGRMEMFTGESVNTLTFVERGGITTVTYHLLYPDRAARDRMIGSGMTHGVAENFDCIEEMLGARAPQEP
jgi:uncharacterized protein YndB with AHSA1/START domain